MSNAQRFLDDYLRTFSRFDRASLMTFFTFPLHVVSATDSGPVVSVAEETDWPAVLDGLLGAYAALGVAGAQPLDVDVAELGPSVMSVRVHWNLQRADGSGVYDFTAVYTVVASADGFRVAAIAHDELPKLAAAMSGT